MYSGLGKSIIQFVVPPPGHGPLDILSGRQSEHFKIKWGQANLFCGHNLPPDWRIGLLRLTEVSGDKSPLSQYVPAGLLRGRRGSRCRP